MKAKLYRILALVIIVSMIASPARAQARAQALPPADEAPPAGSAPQDSLIEGETFDLDAFRSAMSGGNPAQGGPEPPAPPLDPEGMRRLQEASGGAEIVLERATGAAGFVRLNQDQSERLAPRLGGGTPEQLAGEFFRQYGSIFGMRSPSQELTPPVSRSDQFGFTRLTYQQVYQGVPVFAGVLHAHFNPQGRLTSVNGVFVPGIELDTTPTLSPEQAAEIALRLMRASGLRAANTTLYVFRQGIASGQPGPNRLAYEVEVTDDSTVREFIYVDAHKGQILQRFAGIHNELHREIYTKSYNLANLAWQEGDPPYTGGDTDVQNLIEFTEDTYDLMANVSGGTFLSWDGNSAKMIGVANASLGSLCPNATWDGALTKFCKGLSGDDTVAHEWGHAYTQSTHNLIYSWQSGALNEAYSDIIGEVVDMLNGDNKPVARRSPNTCSLYSPIHALVRVESPFGIAGVYPAQAANFGPMPGSYTITSFLSLVQDTGGVSVTDGCQPITNVLAGAIAMIDGGGCNSITKVRNAHKAGALGVIIGHNQPSGLPNVSSSDYGIAIPVVGVTQETGALLKGSLLKGDPVFVTLTHTKDLADNSVLWLSGEDDSTGAVRDLWNPNCLLQPGKTSDPLYYCGTGDEGGVHYNSGVPNHAFALLVDGGVYNGQTITGIGLTKAFHIYWRAMFTYQTPTTDFSDHADALDQSCRDLTGGNLSSLEDGTPSGEIITPADCGELAKAIAAVELRTPPAQCGYTPMLDPNTPAVCSSIPDVLFEDDFETASTDDWTVTVELGEIAWQLSSELPGGQTGRAFFGPDPNYACDADHTGLTVLTSPEFTIPEGVGRPVLSFDHFVATEDRWDGGNVWLVVNGVEKLVATEHFIFNPYPRDLLRTSINNTNPLAGLPAFTGTDKGPNMGSWGQSQIDLGPYVNYGDKVQVRFKMGLDQCAGFIGWYVDNVQVSACSPESAPDPMVVIPGGGDTLKAVKFAEPDSLKEVTFSLMNWGDGQLEWTLDEDEGEPAGRTAPPGSEATAGSGALTAGSEALTAGSEALTAGSEALTAGSEALTAGSEALTAGSVQGKNTVQNGSFEGSMAPWNETVSSIYTAYCTVTSCPSELAFDGEYYMWWGDYSIPHHTKIWQQIHLAATGDAVLGFYVSTMEAFGTPPLKAGDWLIVTMDGDELWRLNEYNKDSYFGYTYVELDISDYADGGQHELAFEANTVGGILLDSVFTEDNDYPCDNPAEIDWLDVQPASGVVAPKSSMDLVATFGGPVMSPGNYSAHLCIETNSVEKPLLVVPVKIRVVENLPPSVNLIASLEGFEGQVITTTVTATDPDIAGWGDYLTFSLEQAPAGATIDPDTGLFSWTPGEEHGGQTFNLIVAVTDSGGMRDDQPFSITVHETDMPPLIDPIADLTVDEGELITTTVTAKDPDIPVLCEPLAFGLTQAPPGASIHPDTGLFSWTPDETHGGQTFTATVVVTETTGLAASRTFSIIVGEVNEPPVLKPVDDVTVRLNQTVTFTVSATDADIPADTLTLSMESAPSGASFDPATGLFTWLADRPGAFQATFTASDGKAERSITVTITVEGGRILLPYITTGG